ncbi:unnamed protein product [Moneuplotes crassus]|uniref:Thioredoxin domain-containing protein n=1 Tax=Euplotes crassus TaxID=5936 RepID=A0AAD1U5J3_EUPCR|nr:unnamed protein product [Moneuplotes crassus]
MGYSCSYSEIEEESQSLTYLLRRYTGSKAKGHIIEHLNTMEGHICKNKKKLIAKDFPSRHQWFNTEPLSLRKELKDKLVVIDFWTYCCINCLHVLPDLEWLENKYSDEAGIAFVGCHSAKFSNEKESDKVQEAVRKYDVKHPVFNDKEMIFWEQLERNSWPSIAILSPDGVPILFLSGEGHRERINLFLEVAVDFYGDRLDRTPLDLYLEEEKEIEERESKENRLDSLTSEESAALKSNLRFPSKVICIANQALLPYDGNVMIFSDTGNNRVIIADLETNECLDVVGSGKIGFDNGEYENSSFHHPQGICHIFKDEQHYLYVCDSNNHAIRRINLNKKEVATVIGTGKQGNDREGNQNPDVQELSSPWDIVAINKDTLIIAMAGIHQIWALNLKNNKCFNFSGTGAEANLDSDDSLNKCAWSQPSGLSLGVLNEETTEIYVADSESSAIRAIDMKSCTSSRNVVGGDNNPYNLFAYGDKDGVGIRAKLQHPLGVHFVKNKNIVLVTDTYNHKIKIIDPLTDEIHSWLGNGEGGLQDGNLESSQFSEPSGCYSIWTKDISGNDKLTVLIADTNNHCIRTVDYEDGEVTTLELKNIPPARTSFNPSKTKAMEVKCEGGVCYPKFKNKM